MAKVGVVGRGAAAPFAPGERTVAASAMAQGGVSRTSPFGPPHRGSGPRSVLSREPNRARGDGKGSAPPERSRAPIWGSQPGGLPHRRRGPAPDRCQHWSERLGDLQLLFRPVGSEGGQETVSVTVDAEHGGSNVLVPSLIRPLERRRAQVTAARIQWHRSHHHGMRVQRVLADLKDGSTPAPCSSHEVGPCASLPGRTRRAAAVLREPQQPSPGLPGVRRPRPPSRPPLTGNTERRRRHHEHHPS